MRGILLPQEKHQEMMCRQDELASHPFLLHFGHL